MCVRTWCSHISWCKQQNEFFMDERDPTTIQEKQAGHEWLVSPPPLCCSGPTHLGSPHSPPRPPRPLPPGTSPDAPYDTLVSRVVVVTTSTRSYRSVRSSPRVVLCRASRTYRYVWPGGGTLPRASATAFAPGGFSTPALPPPPPPPPPPQRDAPAADRGRTSTVGTSLPPPSLVGSRSRGARPAGHGRGGLVAASTASVTDGGRPPALPPA